MGEGRMFGLVEMGMEVVREYIFHLLGIIDVAPRPFFGRERWVNLYTERGDRIFAVFP